MKPFCLQIGKKPEHITIRQRAAALEMAIFLKMNVCYTPSYLLPLSASIGSRLQHRIVPRPS